MRLPLALTERLRALAVASNATLFHVFLAAYAIVLSRYSRKGTLNIGVPVTNRNRLELEGLIGFFINVVVARIGVDGSQPFPSCWPPSRKPRCKPRPTRMCHSWRWPKRCTQTGTRA